MIIKDSNILLSVVNTALRDKYSSFLEYCEEEGVDACEVESLLNSIGYYYDEDSNSFKLK